MGSVEAPVNGISNEMKSSCRVRVIYADTDAYGIVYYANYIKWFEIGRNQLLRENGFRYADLGREGILLPLTEVSCRYLASARYDDLLLIETTLKYFRKVRIRFDYEIWDEPRETLLAEGESVHTFMKDGKIFRPSSLFHFGKMRPNFGSIE